MRYCLIEIAAYVVYNEYLFGDSLICVENVF